MYGLIGRSGAGKSTLLRMLNGLDKPDAGSVAIDGTDITRFSRESLRPLRFTVGMVFQQFNLMNSRTVADNVALPMKLAGVPQGQVATRVSELLRFVGLEEKAFAKPRRLSGGQKQRVGVARAIANQPSILLADEATSALDPQTTTEIVQLLKNVNDEFGITMVVVTHEMDVIGTLADRASILDQGRIVETGDVHQILSRPQHPVTQGLVGAYTQTELSREVRVSIEREFPGRKIRLHVDDSFLQSPTLSRLAREHRVDFSVVQGGVSRVKDQPYGRLSLALFGDDLDIERFTESLTQYTEVTEW